MSQVLRFAGVPLKILQALAVLVLIWFATTPFGAVVVLITLPAWVFEALFAPRGA